MNDLHTTGALRRRLTVELGEDLSGYTPTATLRGLSSERPPSTPRTVDRLGDDLDALAPIGEGGTGVVESARERSLRRQVAVKRPHQATDSTAVQHLVHEASLTARLAHPAIVPVHQLFHDEHAGPVMVMSLLEGQTWQERLEEGPPGIEATVAIAIEVARALEHAHERDILHLDLKPQNIFLGPNGAVHLIDWGNALDLANDPPRRTLRGTPAFMAPEMTEPERTPLGPATDVYLLGATLFAALVGRPPHLKHDLLGSMRAARDPVQLPEDLPDDLRRVLKRALALTPADRYGSAAAFRTALQQLQADAKASALVGNLRRDLAAAGDAGLAERAALVDRAHAIVEVWPGYEPALELRDGLAQNVLAEALDADDLRIAHRMADRIGHLPEAAPLCVALEDLEAEMQRATEDRRTLEAQLELAPGAPERRRVFMGLAVLYGLVYSLLYLQRPGPELNPPLGLFGVVVALSVAIGGVVYWNRRALWSTWASRQAVLVIGMAFLGPLLNRTVGVLLDVPSPDIVRTDLLLVAVTLTTQARLDRVFLWAGLICFGSFAIASIDPDSTRLVSTLGTLAATSLLGWAWNGAPGEVSLPERPGRP